MLISEFDYELPEELIAQEPLAERSGSRMLVVDRKGGEFSDHAFTEFPSFLRAGDLLVVNNTRVFPARLLGRARRVRRSSCSWWRSKRPAIWETLARPADD